MLDRHTHQAGASEPYVPAASASPGTIVKEIVRANPRPNGSPDPRRRILDALLQTVALRGYDHTTIERVLHLADVPMPVFDEHFEDKQDCLLAALDDLIGQLECAVVERIDRSTSWSERMRLGLQTLLTTLARHPDGAQVALVECLSAGEPAIARVRRAVASCVPVLEEGRLSSAIAVDCLPEQTSEGIVGGIAAILHRRVLEGHTAELPALLPDLLYFALMPYLGHHRALAAAGAAGA